MFHPIFRTLHIITILLLSSMLVACGGGNIAGMLPEAPMNRRSTQLSTLQLEIGKPQFVWVACLGGKYLGRCTVGWRDPEGFVFNRDMIIYRNTMDDFATAIAVHVRSWAAGASPFWDYDVEDGTRYYYWVVFEDTRTGERSPVSESASDCPRSNEAPICPPAQQSGPDPQQQATTLPFLRETSDAHYQAVKQPLLVTEAQQAPVYHDGTHLFVGIDQGTDHLADIQFTGSFQSSSIETVVTPTGSYRTSITSTKQVSVSKRGDWDIRHGFFDVKQGHGRAAKSLESYLRETAQVQRAGIPSVLRFTTPPVVRFGGTATAADVDRLIRAVQLVNAALPLEWRLQMPSGLPTSEMQDGIYVEFAQEADYEGADSLGKASMSYSRLDGTINYATIMINKAYRQHGERGAVGVLAHELIHALGIAGHVSQNFHSIMPSDLDLSQQAPLSLLYPIDREALRALYGRMQPGGAATDFGAWADASTHLHAHGEHAAFGVAWRNDYGEPWAYGYLPETDLADNPALTGRALWMGFLLGFTPEAVPVAGDASVGVNLYDLTGTASFSRLESWAAGDAPGDLGTGTQWSDGDLFYAIAVVGNTFRQTAGDDGILTGAFFGESHEGMGGTLERDDLTAAFGGKR